MMRNLILSLLCLFSIAYALTEEWRKFLGNNATVGQDPRLSSQTLVSSDYSAFYVQTVSAYGTGVPSTLWTVQAINSSTGLLLWDYRVAWNDVVFGTSSPTMKLFLSNVKFSSQANNATVIAYFHIEPSQDTRVVCFLATTGVVLWARAFKVSITNYYSSVLSDSSFAVLPAKDILGHIHLQTSSSPFMVMVSQIDEYDGTTVGNTANITGNNQLVFLASTNLMAKYNDPFTNFVCLQAWSTSTGVYTPLYNFSVETTTSRLVGASMVYGTDLNYMTYDSTANTTLLIKRDLYTGSITSQFTLPPFPFQYANQFFWITSQNNVGTVIYCVSPSFSQASLSFIDSTGAVVWTWTQPSYTYPYVTKDTLDKYMYVGGVCAPLADKLPTCTSGGVMYRVSIETGKTVTLVDLSVAVVVPVAVYFSYDLVVALSIKNFASSQASQVTGIHNGLIDWTYSSPGQQVRFLNFIGQTFGYPTTRGLFLVGTSDTDASSYLVAVTLPTAQPTSPPSSSSSNTPAIVGSVLGVAAIVGLAAVYFKGGVSALSIFGGAKNAENVKLLP